MTAYIPIPNEWWIIIMIYTWHTNPPQYHLGDAYATRAECIQHLDQAADEVCCVHGWKDSVCKKPKVGHAILLP